ncbi:LysR family transcriptional regulator [Azoarcus sp. TTM-91]|uniref:LysR family transcriptional regulator n=1 Tax=Azoarcus sp. TTM-91 TaxID=2691581 RepID=UPI00145E743C|nr:LysR family transcriptional regulator [Azoarcus sp. TTM-91]NMG37303.1 LysR family transcriptional regulator [Azoarcus sp. TTM-91]
MTLPTARQASRLPPLPAIRAFEAAARLGSIERASEELALTASAVGKRIASLEQLLGVRLLERHARGVTPTAAGLEYQEQVRTALGLLSAAPLHRRDPARRIHLPVCSPPTFGREILVPHLGSFLEQAPQVDVEIVLSVPYLGLRQPGAAVEICATRAGDDNPDIVLDDPLTVVCSPDYAHRYQLQTPADLSRGPLLRSPPESWLPWFAAAGLDWPEPASGPRLVDMGMTISAAACGLGAALVRPSLAWRALRSGELIAPFAVRCTPLTHYAIAFDPRYEGDADMRHAAREFAAWLRSVCARLGGG